MGWSLTAVIHRATGRPPDPYGLALFLCGIVAAYSLDRVFDPPPGNETSWLPRVLRLTGAAASAACTWLLFHVPLRVAALVPFIAAASLLYPALKRLPLSKTIVVSAVWTWAAMALPFHDHSWLGWRSVFLPVSLPVLLLIASGCLLCDLKDADADRASRVRSLPVVIGARAAVAVAVGLAVLAAAIALGEHRPGLAIGGLALGLLGCFPSLVVTDGVGPLIVDATLTLPGLLIATHLV